MSLAMYDMAKLAMNQMERCERQGHTDLARYWAARAVDFLEDTVMELQRTVPERVETIEKVRTMAKSLRDKKQELNAA